MNVRMWALIGLLVATGCLRGGEQRSVDDLEVGVGVGGGVVFEVRGGLANVVTLTPGNLMLWAQSPVLDITLAVAPAATTTWTLEIENCMPGAVMTATADSGVAVGVTSDATTRKTLCRWTLQLPADAQVALHVAPLDANDTTGYRIAVMGDIQQGMAQVHEVFDAINRVPGVRMVLSTGDVVEAGQDSEYDLFLDQLRSLDVPYYSTIGNHELWGPIDRWRRRFGRINVHFAFKGVTFSLVDSANASIDPVVYGWLDEWLAGPTEDVHVFLTHFPPFDPVGVRNGSFRSRKEAAKLLARLSDGGVDLTLYGHIHSYYKFENAGMPAHISGGGGARFAEVWDGVGRHFLAVDVVGGDDPAVLDVRMIPVD